jgi:hypothetical protein
LARFFSVLRQKTISRPVSPDRCIPEPLWSHNKASNTGIFSASLIFAASVAGNLHETAIFNPDFRYLQKGRLFGAKWPYEAPICLCLKLLAKT